MAKKIAVSKDIEEIKSSVKSGKAIIGTKITLKNLKLGKVLKVFVTANAPEDIRSDIEHYAKISNAEVITLTQPNDELGTLCKKPFAISVVCLLK